MGYMGLIFLAIGLAAGVLSGLFGIGGGLLIVPTLMAVANFSTRTALGTSLASLLLPVGLLGAYAYYQSGEVNVEASLLIALGLFLGAGVRRPGRPGAAGDHAAAIVRPVPGRHGGATLDPCRRMIWS
jgi:uncharacterized membrane protein YfcA